ncbi:type II toxin-antitoxin system VapB family antitoxin [Thiohalocapsa sp. ML1]|jgi:antitoxin VapB|uniref:type II toxin-antitoxin system VapB family antitoxin n=1 Tax=Thiohalocapsa sp. ML1 TaxID=1431688 RepID=UPI000731FE1C|nr:type II toxin-antitoxin system VapB family antitoxin [Thiohalocapsa sp. ML1]
MSLNIKSTEADTLVTALADLTGETKTRAVLVAVKERLERIKRRQDQEALSADLMRIGRRCVGDDHGRHIDHAELLYDERGLPR